MLRILITAALAVALLAGGTVSTLASNGNGNESEPIPMMDISELESLVGGMEGIEEFELEPAPLNGRTVSIDGGFKGVWASDNTPESAAIGTVVTGSNLEDMVGRGTGLDDQGLQRKRAAIQSGIQVNQPDPEDGLDILAKIGGFEIGGIAGLIIGAALKRRLAVVDGFISTAAALIAVGLQPLLSDYFILSHLSAEQGHECLVEFLDKAPLLDLGMRLGEGTGAALAIELIDAAVSMLSGMATFDEAGVDKKLK